MLLRRRRVLAFLLLAIALILFWLRRRLQQSRKKLLPNPILLLSRKPTTEPSKLAAQRQGRGFCCFLSHYKVEAATEARWLQEALEAHLEGERAFLDSDDLLDLSRLKDHVRESKCLLLLQTRSVLSRRPPRRIQA